MNTKRKSNKRVRLLAYAVLCIFFIACSTPRYGSKIMNVKRWVRLEIRFKKEANEEEKNQALKTVEKYYIDNLYKDNPDLIFSYIKFKVNNTVNLPKNNFAVTLSVGLGYASTSAVSTLPPTKGPGPKIPGPPKDIPGIQDITTL